MLSISYWYGLCEESREDLNNNGRLPVPGPHASHAHLGQGSARSLLSIRRQLTQLQQRSHQVCCGPCGRCRIGMGGAPEVRQVCCRAGCHNAAQKLPGGVSR